MELRIRNAHTFGIPGGWTLTHPEAEGVTITGTTWQTAISNLEAHFRANNKFYSYQQLFEYAEQEWAQRVIAAGQGNRIIGALAPHVKEEAKSPKPIAVPPPRTELTPKETGASLWGVLHLIPLVWDIHLWRSHITLMTRLIEPGKHNPFNAGCIKCSAHWKTFRSANPPDAVISAKYAAQWSWKAHNAANSHAGHPKMSWEDAAKIWGWPPSEWKP